MMFKKTNFTKLFMITSLLFAPTQILLADEGKEDDVIIVTPIEDEVEDQPPVESEVQDGCIRILEIEICLLK